PRAGGRQAHPLGAAEPGRLLQPGVHRLQEGRPGQGPGGQHPVPQEQGRDPVAEGLRPVSRALQTLLAAFALILGLASASAAFAHTRSESHSDWQIEGTHIETTVAIPEIEVKRLGPPGSTITNEQVARYMQGKASVSAGGKPCANPGGAKALAATGQFRRVQYEFNCATDKNMQLGFTGFF